jgi:hypothetical protein
MKMVAPHSVERLINVDDFITKTDNALTEEPEAHDGDSLTNNQLSDEVVATVANDAVDTTMKTTGDGEIPSTVSGGNAPHAPAQGSASYKPFPVNVLPEAVRNYVSAASAAIGCDPAFVALPLLGSLARAIGNSRVIRLKATWTESAIIWVAIVGKSGTHKTPAIQAGTQFLQRHEHNAIEQFEKAQGEYREHRLEYERDLAAWKSSKEEPTTHRPQSPKEPSCVRYIAGDITIEALAAILAAQSDGVLVVRDELAGWLDGIAEYKGGRGSDLGHWLASWSGTPMTVDRKSGSQKLLHAPRAAVSIVGGIQPGVLKRAIGREHLHDGLCARLLLAMPDPRPVRWSEATVSRQNKTAMAGVFDGLLALEPSIDKNGNPIPQAIPLSDAARAAWVSYFNRHREESTQLDDDFAAAWSKLEAYTARFALIFQLSSLVAGEPNASPDVIDESAMLNAIALSDWFGGEARRVYGLFAESEADRHDRELCEQIRRMGGCASVRNLMRSSRRFATAGNAEAALARLARRGLGRWELVPPGPKGGQPTSVFHLVDAVDADTTSTNFGNKTEVSASAESEVRDESLGETSEGDPSESPELDAPALTGKSEMVSAESANP